MLLFFIGTLLAIVLGVFALQFFARLHAMNVVTMSQRPVPGASRYRPMLRLLSDEDLGTGGFSRPVLRKIRAQRRLLFRAYLRCLTKDYGRLLMGIRMVMVNSGVDRPDLAALWPEIRFFSHLRSAGLNCGFNCTRLVSATWMFPGWSRRWRRFESRSTCCPPLRCLSAEGA